MAITAKSLRVFSAVEALRGGNADVRQALLPLFRPDLAKFNGEVYDPTKVAREINQEYKLNITGDIVQEMTPLFVAERWLEQIPTAEHLAYRVTCPDNLDVLASNQAFEARAKELGAAFRVFVDKLSPLSSVNRTDAELVDVLVDWLLSLDVYSQEELKTVRKVSHVGKKLVFETVTVDQQKGTDENYLCARFVDTLIEGDSPLVPFLVELASVGLITDVVRDFQKPTSGAQSTELSLYLDAPVAFDYLGLSGVAAQENMRMLLGKLISLGGNIRIFRVSVEEMQNSLGSMLSRIPADRDGPTAQALRRGEVIEAYVRKVANSPDGVLKSFGVSIVDQSEEAFPNEHKFFTKGDIQDLYAAIHWVKEDLPRYHDALVGGLIIRKRGAVRSNDLFEVKHLIVTKNPYFAPVARRLCLEKHYIGPNHVGPVVHQRQLATALWLRAGLGPTDQEVPRRYILSACRRVLTVHRNIIERVRYEARNLNEAKREQLELLLTEGRSTQVLMDKTLGSASVIDSTNIDRLVREMRRSVAAEAFEEADRKVEIAKRAADEARQRADEVRREAEAQAQSVEERAAIERETLSSEMAQMARASRELEERLATEAARLRRVGDALINTVNSRIAKRRRRLGFGGLAVLVVAEGIPIVVGGQTGAIVTAALFLVTIALHAAGVLKRVLLNPVLAMWDRELFERELEEAGMSLWDYPYEIEYRDGTFQPLSTDRPPDAV